MTVQIVAKGLEDVAEFLDEFPDIALQAAVLAVNDGASDSVPSMRRKIEEQVNFPAGYLSRDRLGIRKRATKNDVEATISGRDRPTSLARFVQGRMTPKNSRGKPLTVQVSLKKGRGPVPIPGFLITLKNGNVGFAFRTRQGRSVEASTGAVELAPNLYLLYGPSVDQALKDVGDKEIPDIQSRVTREFFRQFSRLSKTRG